MQTTDSNTGRTVLIVDDEPQVLSALRVSLERAGLHVVTCAHPEIALAKLEDRAFGVILSDHIMPGMTGLDFFAQARQIQPHASRILITAVMALPTLVDAINRGEIYRFLAKPWLREELLAAVSNGFTRYELLERNAELIQQKTALNDDLAKSNEALQTHVSQLEKTKLELERANASLAQRYNHSLELCSRILATYDSLLAGQTKAIAGIVEQLINSPHFSADEREALYIAGWLCDLGLIGVSREIYHTFLRQPENLSTQDITNIHGHPSYSQTLAAYVDGRESVSQIIRSHHERFDGLGYPDRLAGESIPWAARCLAVAVGFVECQLPKAEALAYIDNQAGQRFDPEAVRVFRQQTRFNPLPGRVVEILLSELKPGMTLAKGLYTPHGMLLVGEGQSLNSGTIHKIVSHNLTSPICQRLLVYS
jgi:response regulator RpfG family c-di-GMP phosphodiesterase